MSYHHLVKHGEKGAKLKVRFLQSKEMSITNRTKQSKTPRNLKVKVDLKNIGKI